MGGPGRMVIVILGPPGSGKSTLARSLAEEDDLRLFDRDEPEWAGMTDGTFIHELEAACMETRARVVVVRTGKTPLARRRIIRHATPNKVIVLDTPISVCRKRVLARPGDIASALGAIDDWISPTPEERAMWPGEN